jgi:hypothetical protein
MCLLQRTEGYTIEIPTDSPRFACDFGPSRPSYANAVRDGTWRQIAVAVDGQARVRARQGYRAAGR